MKKIFIKSAGILVASAMAVGFALPAFAATFSNVQFDNGDVTISGQGGSTVNATFHIIVPTGQVVEYVQTDVISDSLAPVDTSVGGTLGLQEGTYDVSVPVKLPPNTGTYTLSVQGAGIYGGIRSVSGNDNVVGTASFTSALRVVANADGSVTVGGESPSWLAALSAQIAALVAALKPVTTPAPTPSTAACTAYAQANAGTVPGATNVANATLQGFLLGQHANINGLLPVSLGGSGWPFGYYGPQTTAAVSWFQTMNHCN